MNASRRRLLKLLALSAGAGSARAISASPATIDQTLDALFRELADTVKLTLYRPEDLLELELVFTGYKKSPGNHSLQKTSGPQLLIVYFTPQALAEEAFEEGGEAGSMSFSNNQTGPVKGNEKSAMGSQNPRFPARAYLSGRSRLVFSIPASVNSIPLTAEALLNWDKFTPVVSKRAASPKLFPVFNASDTNDNYKNILIKEGPAINLNTPVTVPQGNNQQPAVNNQNIRIQQLPANNADRQVQLNNERRAATKTEERQIQKTEAPITLTQTTVSPQVIAIMDELRNGKTPRPVHPEETCIEFPYRLFISPNEYSAWNHDTKLKGRPIGGIAPGIYYELWHTRLTCKNCVGGKDLSDSLKSIRSVRALWGTDINGDFKVKPARDNSFITSLYNDDRHCIVHESSNWALPGGFVPKPVQVNNLMLSTLGAWFDAELEVKRNDLDNAGLIGSLNLLKWKHIATMARDHYVEVVYAGNMFPFGHEASLVRITERKPQAGYAVNRQRYFIVITEEEKKYDPYDPKTGNFRSFNFSTIKFISTSTPTIDPPKKFCNDLSNQADHQFMPMVGGKHFQFKLVGYDLDGNETDFTMPLVFLTTDVTVKPGSNEINSSPITKVISCYNNSAFGKNTAFRGQKLSLARSVTPGDTLVEVQEIDFIGVLNVNEKPGFQPRVKQLDIYIEALENITGNRKPVKVTLVDDEQHIQPNKRKNKGAVFARLVDASDVAFGGGKSKLKGGMMPDFSVTGLSKTFGAVGGKLDDIMNTKFDPKSFFDDSAKLFGTIALGDIINVVDKVSTSMDGPSLKTALPALKNYKTDQAFVTEYSWNAATLKAHDFGFGKFKPKNAAAGNVVIEAKLQRFKDTSKGMLFELDSHIGAFDIILMDIAAVQFKRVGFKVNSSAKLDFSIDLEKNPIRFLGALSFVNDLQKFIPADGFSDPPFLDVTPSGVTTGYTLGLPDVQLGIFTLRHITLGAAIRLPFDGSPLSLRFNFCERQQPFTLTVSALGGGGFFAIEFDMKGLKSLEAALEFGAAVSLNLGVASGAVSVMGGIYFKMEMEQNGKKIELSGYVRVNGALSVLGLITVSVEFLLSLNAEMKSAANGESKVSRMWGEATLKVKIEILFFSKTVKLKVQREFAGAGADPTFGMLISENEWLQYCDTFAA